MIDLKYVEKNGVREAGLIWLCMLFEHLYLKWCMVRYGSKNGHQIEMCIKEIEPSPQNLLTILDSIVNITGGPLQSCIMKHSLHFDNK